MNALQKRLEQIGTEPHENGLCDGIVFEDNYNREYWILNHYSLCEWLKHYMVHYAGFTWQQATERLNQTGWLTPDETITELGYTMHELTYNIAMKIAKGHMYWEDGTPSNTLDFQEEHNAWHAETKEKYHLNEEYESLDFLERFVQKDNYAVFKHLEGEMSQHLAIALGVPPKEISLIDECFKFLLEHHQKFNAFDTQMKELTDAVEKKINLHNALEQMFDNLPVLSQIGNIYIFAKILFYDNIIATDYLKGTYMDSIFQVSLIHIYVKKCDTPINATQMLLVADYLSKSPIVGDNGALLKTLLELIEKNEIEKQWTKAQEADLLKILVAIHQKINYCDNLELLKEIFKYIHKNSTTEVFGAINHYKAAYRQGGMQMLEVILHTTFSEELYRDFELKSNFISLLSEAVDFDKEEEIAVKTAYLEKWKTVKPNLNEEVLESVLSGIEYLKHYKVLHLTQDGEETNFGVADTLAKGFLKAVEWIREELTGIPLVQTALDDLFDQKTEGNIDLKNYLLKKKELEAGW